MLAGVSVDYYTRMERGNLSGVSEEVLESLAEALQLDEAERGHLFDLARAANASGVARTRARRAPAPVLRPAVQRIVDALDGAPAFVRNARLDVLGSNLLGRALYAPLYDSPQLAPGGPVNTARFQFLDPAGARAFWGEKADRMAHDAVAILRAEAGRNPYDKRLAGPGPRSRARAGRPPGGGRPWCPSGGSARRARPTGGGSPRCGWTARRPGRSDACRRGCGRPRPAGSRRRRAPCGRPSHPRTRAPRPGRGT